MHDQMRVRQPAVDLLDHAHRQDVAVRLAAELVGAVRGAHGDRERVDLGARDEVDRLVGIGQQLVVAELALDAVAILRSPPPCSSEPSTPSSPSTEAPTQCAMIDDAAGDRDVVVVVGRRLGVGLRASRPSSPR